MTQAQRIMAVLDAARPGSVSTTDITTRTLPAGTRDAHQRTWAMLVVLARAKLIRRAGYYRFCGRVRGVRWKSC